MRGVLLGIVLAAGSLLAGPSMAQVNPYALELEDQTRTMVRRASSQLLHEKNFPVLDRAADEYRTGKNRTLSGIWLLTLFYDGLNLAKPPGTPDLTEADWDEHIAKLRAWTKAAPKSPASHIALAQALKSKGWWHRGPGYAHTVTQTGWKAYHKYLMEAASVLDTVKSFAAVDPAWFEKRIGIALDLSVDSKVIDLLMKEAIAMEPGYLQFYLTAANRMLPKWGGTYAGLEAWARAATDNVETAEGRSLYARILWYVWENNPEFQFEYMHTHRMPGGA